MAGPGQGLGEQALQVPRPVRAVAEPEHGLRHRHLAEHELSLKHRPRVVPHPQPGNLAPPGTACGRSSASARDAQVDLAPIQPVLHPCPGSAATRAGSAGSRPRSAWPASCCRSRTRRPGRAPRPGSSGSGTTPRRRSFAGGGECAVRIGRDPPSLEKSRARRSTTSAPSALQATGGDVSREPLAPNQSRNRPSPIAASPMPGNGGGDAVAHRAGEDHVQHGEVDERPGQDDQGADVAAPVPGAHRHRRQERHVPGGAGQRDGRRVPPSAFGQGLQYRAALITASSRTRAGACARTRPRGGTARRPAPPRPGARCRARRGTRPCRSPRSPAG